MALEKQLTSAAWSGDLEGAKALLKEDPEAARHWQPIMTAAFTGSAELVGLLLDHGADPNVVSRNNHRHRPLHRVLEHKKTIPKGPHHVDTVRVLLERGARVDLRGGHGRMTAPCLAAVDGEVQFLPVLREYIEEWDIFTSTALGEEDRVRALLDEDPGLVGAVDENRWRPLNYGAASAAGRDDAEAAARLERIVALLLERGAEVNRPPPALTSAIGNPAMMRALLDAGAKPDPGLISALWNVDYDSVELLLEAGADIRHPAVDDALSELVQYGTYKMARFLIDRGANVNGVDDHRGRTALHWAAVRGAGKEFVGYLLEQGADPSIVDRDGATALDVVRERKRKTIESMLLERGAG